MVDPPEPTVVDAAAEAAARAMERYFAELAAVFGADADVPALLAAAAESYNPPHGLFAVVGSAEQPVACGGVTWLDADVGEIKRMWVDPDWRGRGVAARLLAYLEDLVRASGRTTVVLDTSRLLTAAIALYERHGYERVAAYNDNPNADYWFRKSLVPPAR